MARRRGENSSHNASEIPKIFHRPIQPRRGLAHPVAGQVFGERPFGDCADRGSGRVERGAVEPARGALAAPTGANGSSRSTRSTMALCTWSCGSYSRLVCRANDAITHSCASANRPEP
jgi:hypothetical protein